MAKKVKSQPMREILHRLTRYPYIHVCVFEENQILDCPVDEWPIVDALLCFYSHAFPLEKAIAYAELRKPYLVNDVKWQRVLLDRRQVYEILLQKSIPVPRFEVFSHIESPQRIVCTDDSIDVNGHTFHKPFVEKPIMADDHNICIYFPSTAGGGSQRLFRKVGDRSSEYVKDGNQVREDGIYIYEEFMATDGTDVKIYTVSEDYAHAEARKCPALDGVVERDHEGKEIRYPVILSPWEKLIAKKIVRAFKQQICGFDLLRTQGQSYVCDVNGFSFVKNSRKYYDDCAHVLAHLLTRHLCPNHFLALHHQPHSTHTHKQHQNQHLLHFQHHAHHSPLLNNTPRASIGPVPFDWQGATGGDALDMDVDESILVDTKGHPMELRCVIAVIRHGDRTPKQKMKMSVRHPRLCQFFIEQGGSMCPARKSRHELKLKQPNQLQRLLDIVHELLHHQSISGSVDEDLCGVKRSDLQQLKLVLELYGHFRGINRKVQMKFQQKSNQSASSTANHDQLHDDDSCELHFANAKIEKKVPPHSDCQDVDGECVFGDSSLPSTACLLLIAKWGGELTSAGRQQAENLGKAFRRIYPGRGGGLLRLHSTFRHDLKIYASEEGRVQMTAAAFAKGFLALEGDLAPILVQMVKSANTNGLLGCDKKCRKYKAQVKRRMHHRFMTKDAPLTQEDMEHLAPTQSMSLLRALRSIENPVAACHALCEHVKRMFQRVARLAEEQRTSPTSTIYHNESWDLILRRWGKLLEDFCRPSSSVKKCRGDLQTSTGSSTESTSSESTQNGLQENECDARPTFDLSKVLDIYDNIKYDIHHNAHILDLHEAHVFFHRAKALADYLTTQEYGVTVSEKLVIGQRICLQLMRKVLADAQYTEQQDAQHIRLNSSLNSKLPQAAVSTPGRFVRTRLYFTSESHLHSLLSCLRFGELKDKTKDVRWKKAMDYIDSLSELNYLSQLVVVIYEDPTKHPEQEERFSVEVMFSPGSYPLPRHALPHNLTLPKDDTGNLVGRENVFDGASSSLLTPQSVETCAITSHDFPETTAHQSQFRFILNGFPRHDSTEALNSGQATEAGLRKDSFKANFLEEMTQGDKQSSDGMPLSRNSLSESALAHLEINIGSRSNAEEVPLRMYASSLGEQSILGRLHSSNVQSALPSEHFESITSTSAPQTRTSLRPSFGSVMDPYYAVLRQEMQSPRTGRLISTAVIDPDAEEVASIQATESVDVVTESPVARSITSAPSVEEVYPLETLTNSLTLSQLEDFLMRLTTQKYPTPWSSPRSSETANTTSNNHSDQPLTQQKLLNLFDL